MKYLKVLNVVLVVTLLLLSTVWGEDTTAKSKSQTNCPVMGVTINKEVYTDYQGKRVYFCCPGCIPEFKKEPAKYIKKLEDAGVTIEKIPDKSSPKKKSQGCGDGGGCS